MSRRTHKALNPFHHPGSGEVEYPSLLEAMRECRKHVNRLRGLCGLRNPLTREAEALIAQIDAVAALTRVPGAEQYVKEVQLGHSTPMARGDNAKQQDS
jgi:hypothetical protein